MLKNGVLELARDLLSRTPLADGHNDLPWALRELVGSDLDQIDLRTEQPSLHTDLVRLRRGRIGLQFWSVYVPCRFTGHSAVTAVLEQIELVHELASRYPDHLTIATTVDEAEAAFAAGRIASLMGAEGGHSIAGSIGVLRALHRLGVRYMTLTHDDNTPWADSATDQPQVGGLNAFGKQVVGEMNRLGMLVDLAHVAPATMRDALAVTRAPVIFSHSSCRGVVDHPRNVPDDVLGALRGNDGVCMVTFVPAFVSTARRDWDAERTAVMHAASADPADKEARERAADRWAAGHPAPKVTVDDVVTHVEHAREVAGIDHIGIGGDYDGVSSQPVGLEDVSTYPVLFATLLDRGWSAGDCAKLAGRNVLRALGGAEEAAGG